MKQPLKMISDSKHTLLAGKRIRMHAGEKMKKVNCYHIWMLAILTGIFIFSSTASSYASTDLTVTVPASATEGDGVLVDVGTVTALEVSDFDLVVDLISDDSSEVTVPATVTILAGQTSATFDITIINDGEIDGIQTVTISASSAGWTVGTAAIDIEDNDPGLLQFSSDSYTIDENSGSANIIIVRTQNSNGTITVDYATQDDTATAGSDYTLTSGTLTFGDGETEKSFAVNIIDDDFVEVDETVILTLSNPGGGALLGSVAISELTIVSDDSVDYFTEQFTGENDLDFQSLTFMLNGSGSFYSVCRQETDVFPTSPDGGIILSLSDDSFQQVTLTGGKELPLYGVNYSEFFVSSNGYITFDSGDTDYSETLYEHFSQPRISGLYHDLYPGNGGTVSWKQLVDRVVVTYLNIPEYGSSNQNSFQVELFFDGTIRTTYLQIDAADGISGLSAGNGLPADFQESDLTAYDLCFLISLPESVTEGDGVLLGQGIVGLLDSTADDLLVDLSVNDPSEITLPATVTIPAGQNSAVFDITVEDDIILDGSQAVTIIASTAGNPVALATVWVHDNETTILSLNIPAFAAEGDGVLTGQGSLSADTPVESDVTVNLVSDDPTEVTVPETVTLLTGQNSAVFDMVIVDDTEIDGLQTATITASVVGWTYGGGTIEVQDNETKVLTITLPAIVNEGDGVLMSAGSVSIEGTFDADLSLDMTSDDPSEVTVPDTVTIPAGQTSVMFDLTIIDDGEIDGIQTVTIRASSADWNSGSVIIEVEDNDPGTLQFSSDAYLVNEDEGSINVSVERTTASIGTISVDYTVSDGSATSDIDYTAVSGTLTFNVGETEKMFSIPILDDFEKEVNETVYLTLSNPGGGGSLGSPEVAVLTIIENDFYLLPYYQSFSNGLLIPGWELYSSNSYGHIQVTGERLRMDNSGGDYSLNEAILSLDPTGYRNIELTFFQGEFGDEIHSLPGSFTGHVNGDGVAISNDGITWYTILNATELDVGSSAQLFIVDLDAEVAEIQANYDVSFSYSSNLIFKFQQYDNSAYSSDGREWDDISVTGVALISVTIPEITFEGDGLLVGQGTVSLEEISVDDVLVALSSSDSSEVAVPADITIPAGQNSATFDLSIVDDAILDGTQNVIITASATGYGADTVAIKVHDNETAILTVEIADSATEGDGVLFEQGAVFVSEVVDKDVIISLNSNDPSEVTVPDTVTIINGQTSATFDLTIVDDMEFDGMQSVIITASVNGWTSGNSMIDIEDNENADLAVTVPATANEGNGLMAEAGTVTIPGTLTSDLIVNLSSDDTSKVTLPSIVTIPTGQMSAVFDITIVENSIIETQQIVTITVSASGWTSGSKTIVIFDNELVHITTSDNENNNGTGIPDIDMEKDSPPCIYNTSSIHPIEFNINVDGPLPVSSAYLSLFIEDIDWPDEQDEVFLNGHNLGFAIGENNLNYSTLFVIPDLSWVQYGDNLVQIYVDRNNEGSWCAKVHSGQLIFDNGVGVNTAVIRSVATDFTGYNFGDIVTIDLDVDTILESQNVRLELLLRNPAGQIFDFDTNPAARNWAIHGNNDEPYQWIFTLPVSGDEGLWGVNIGVYDSATQRFENRKSITFSVPVGAANVPTINSISPNSGPALEATPVVISGTNFIEGETNCVVGGWSIDNLTVVDNVTITGNISPSLIVGSHEAACTTIYGTGTLSDAFTVIGPKIASSLLGHDFGEIYLNDTTAYTFTLSNTGNAELAIETISMTGTGASVFSISNDNCSGQALLPSETCTVDVIFSPAIFGSKSASLSIPSNDPHTPLFNVPITGTGIVEVDLTTASQNVSEEVGAVTITATLNTFSSEDIMIPYTVNGTAIGGGTDHGLADGTITIPAGQVSATVIFNVVDDALNEFDETVIVTMGTPVNARTGVVTIHTIIIIDDDPPEDVTNLKAASYENRLVFTWTHSADTSGDMAGYKVYFNGAAEGVVLSSAQNTHEEIGLNPATGYPMTVTAYDNDGNESAGVSVTGVTILPNPVNLTVEAHSGYVNLAWDQAQPTQYVKHYLVYVSETDFASVAGMTPRRTTGSTTANVAGLTNNVTYYFAVTTVNISGGVQTAVSTIPATPVPDTQGPDIADVKIDNVLLLDGHIITKPCIFTASASDPAGVSRVEFYFDGNLIGTDFSPEYSCYLNITEVTDGPHTLTIVAFDTLGNSTTVERTVVVTLGLPAAPTITEPVNGTVINQPVVTVSGIAEKYIEAMLYNNSVATGDTIPVDSLGKFSFSLTLVEGENRIQAAARNRAGTGPLSAQVLVTLDTGIPSSPRGLIAQAKEGGVVKLTWQAPSETSVAGYNLYRAVNAFTAPAQAVKINSSQITGTTYTDLPPQEGTWYYRATAKDSAGNESPVSNEASAESDSTAPRAASIEYTPQGNYDPVTQRMAPGMVNLVLTVSEPLQVTPFFSITPGGGVPISVELTKDTDLTYTGFFVISDTTPTGTAYAVFSGRDLVGNRGTEIDMGASIKIDTHGPTVRRLVVLPEDPIQNDEQSPVSVTVTLGLDEAIKSGLAPELSYLLSGQGREAVAVNPLTQIAPQSGDVQTWQATFELPADAGLAQAETFRFIYQGIDDLDNINDRIDVKNRFQVYQGDLPPLEPPQGFKGEALPEGKTRLSWDAVEEAVGYQLYRQTPNESELTDYQRIDIGLEYIDEPSVEGLYTYAVASIRSENGQEAVSGLSDSVQVLSDSTAPGAPINLSLELVSNGIEAGWEPPSYTEPVTYSLYRADLPEITSVDGLTPLASGIEQTFAVDPNPSPSEHAYVVTSVDEAGNESAPSNSFYLNFELLPVSSLQVVQTDDDPPQVSWTHPGGDIAGYDIYLGEKDDGVKLNSELHTTLSFTDAGYSEDERRYTVIAVDDSQAESLGRSILLPVMRATLTEGTRIKRGIMNRLEYEVKNLSETWLDNIRLKVDVSGYSHTSDKFSINSSETIVIPVIVGGYDDLEDLVDLTSTVEITPDANEKVEIVRTSQVEVVDGTLVLQILNEEFTRGGSGSVRFTLENTGQAEIEITTAKNSGNLSSDEITYYLLDTDENVISTMDFKQVFGDSVVTLSNGNTVARIPAGETFTSEPILVPVPANAPDDLTLKLSIANIYYHQGQADQVKMNGLSGTHPVTLIETAYYGEVTSISPQSSSGDQDIVITGRAIDRTFGDPLPGVPLKLVITLDGFDRKYEVFTDDTGTYAYTFGPFSGEAGIYTVRAVHPDLTDRPVHGQFVINRVSIRPKAINLSIPVNYEQTVDIQVNCGDGTEADNLRLVYEEDDQLHGVFPEGVHITLGAPILFLGSGQSGTLRFSIWADNTAAQTGSLVLKVKSDETGNDAWVTLPINTSFSEAQPVLMFTPDHVETGVAHDETITETMVLKNNGLEDMYDVSLALIHQDGSPAPEWAYLNASPDQGTLSIGESREISVSFSPTESVPEGIYSFYLRVTSSNYQTVDIGIYASVTLSGIGNVRFKVLDIYTGTLDAGEEPIQGLAGAKIWVQNEVQNEGELIEEYTLTTDSIGEAEFTDLSAGRYKCRITADNHQEYIGRFWIKPGITTTEEVFLDYNLVTVEWEVNEITIEDRYEIVLSAVYETDVPAPVVVIEPASVTLPPMKAGDVFNGEFTLTNYGFIRADDLKFSLPADDQHFTYEILGGLPDTIEAKDRITVPFRVTCLQSLDQEEDGSGGGSCYYVRCMVVDYTYQCVNGVWRWAAAQSCWTYGYGECSGGVGGAWYVYDGAGSGGGSPPLYTPPPSTIDKCFPTLDRKECFAGECCPTKETDKDSTEKTFSSVSTLMREYNRDHVDLSVKVPGGKIDVQRWYYDNRWWFEHERNRLGFNPDSLGTGIKSIDKGGVVYSASTVDSDLFIHDDIYRIRREDDGTYRWSDKSGNWKTFDDAGRMTAYGTRTGVVAKLSYEPGENGRFSGYADRNDTPVFWIEYNSDDLISAVYDIENRRVEYTYSNGLLTTVTDVLENDTSYEYDGEGRIARTVDAAGRESIVTYDDYGSVSSVVDSQGRGRFFEFDYDSGKKEYYARTRTSTGKIKEVWFDRFGDTRRVDVNGRTIKSIAKDGRNLIITDDIGDITRKEFDEWDNLTKVIYPDGSTASYEYEHTFNRRTREIDENGIITEFEYDDSGNLTRKVEASGSADERVTEYTYDANGNLLTTRRIGDADTVEALTVMEYDAYGNLTSLTDPESNVTRFTSHDIMGNVLAKEDARDKTWTYEYDDAGRLKTATDPFTNITQMFYDGAGNKIKEIDGEGKEKLFEYDVRDNLIKITAVIDPENPENNSVTVFEYNTDSKLTKQTDAEGKMIYYQYDSEGRLTKTIDGNGNEISVEYSDTDGSGCSSCSGGSVDQPSRVIYPTFAKEFVYDSRSRKTQEKDILSDTESYVTQFAYDDKGNLISKTDKQEKTTGYVYDSLDRLSKVVDPLTGETQYTYDNRDNLIALRDANSNVTSFEYDKNNRLTKEIRPLGEETSYVYDAAGNLIQKIDAKNQKTTYGYDDAGRLTSVMYFNPGDPVNPVKAVIFTYDKVGNLKSYDDGVTSATYGYDDLYRKISESVNYGPFTRTNAYGYLKNGLKETFTGPDNIAYGYLYDNNNQLAGVQIPDSGFITINSYHWNRPANMTLPGGSTREYDYDPLMRVQQITAKDPGQNILMNYQYTYDKMDNIENKDTEHGSYGYGYDALYRLTTTDNPVQNDEAFTYDGVGNRLTAADTTGDWTYNPNNELGGYDDVSYEYDANGNMTQKTAGSFVTSYVYNIEDRLTEVWNGEVDTGSLTASYYYDPFGRRLWKEVSGVKTYFHYADEGLVAELDATGNVTKSFGYKPGSTWTTDPLFMAENGNYYFYQSDHLGTPQKLTAINGAVVWAVKYSSFGKSTIEVETVENNLRFPGQYYDQEGGLHYNYHRYYNPATGRYLKKDPVGLRGGINLYIYVQGNPANLLDPKGLVGIGGGAYFVVGTEASYSSSTCCEGNAEYNVEVLTICGGGGIGLRGALPISATAGGISSRARCPRTRYYFKHETVFVYRSVNVQVDSHGPSAGIDVGVYGMSTVWIFCSDTVISKKSIGCCNK